MILELFKRMFEPLELCLKAYKLQMHILYNLACMNSIYETLKDRGIGKRMKIHQNNLTNIEKND